MGKDLDKEIFFYIFEKVYKRSCYDNPYEFLFYVMQPAFDCKDCPLGCYENCSNYEDEECLGTIRHAIEKGDIKL